MGFHGPGLMGTFASAGSSAKALGSAPTSVWHTGPRRPASRQPDVTHTAGWANVCSPGRRREPAFSAPCSRERLYQCPNVFEAEYGGFPAAHTGNRRPPAYDLTELTKGLGTDWQSRGVNFKMWACRVPITLPSRPSAACASCDISAMNIRSVEIVWAKVVPKRSAGPIANDITSAQLNLYYVSSLMLLENDCSSDQFRGRQLSTRARHDFAGAPDRSDRGTLRGTPEK